MTETTTAPDVDGNPSVEPSVEVQPHHLKALERKVLEFVCRQCGFHLVTSVPRSVDDLEVAQSVKCQSCGLGLEPFDRPVLEQAAASAEVGSGPEAPATPPESEAPVTEPAASEPTIPAGPSEPPSGSSAPEAPSTPEVPEWLPQMTESTSEPASPTEPASEPAPAEPVNSAPVEKPVSEASDLS